METPFFVFLGQSAWTPRYIDGAVELLSQGGSGRQTIGFRCTILARCPLPATQARCYGARGCYILGYPHDYGSPWVSFTAATCWTPNKKTISKIIRLCPIRCPILFTLDPQCCWCPRKPPWKNLGVRSSVPAIPWKNRTDIPMKSQ